MILSQKNEVEGVRCKDVPISEIQKYEEGLTAEMKSFMYQNYGRGLAAPQVGVCRNLFVMQYGSEIISCYNPKWSARSKKNKTSEESCLTYGRMIFKKVRRYKMINADFVNSEGVPVRLKLNGMDAICFQHETDHLEGKTIFHNGGIGNA